ncbi:MAG: RNA polymerase sigma factor [Pseudomonadota bacterium]
MTTATELNSFLVGVEQKAYRMALMAVKNQADALDIVQDAMLTLAEKYAHKTAADWTPLFYRILRNRITDTHRSRQRGWRRFGPAAAFDLDGDADDADPIAALPAAPMSAPDARSELDATTERLAALVEGLPQRQREAFLLRAWEGLDVAQTASAMGVTAGSVKTHYSRAVHALRAGLRMDEVPSGHE